MLVDIYTYTCYDRHDTSCCIILSLLVLMPRSLILGRMSHRPQLLVVFGLVNNETNHHGRGRCRKKHTVCRPSALSSAHSELVPRTYRFAGRPQEAAATPQDRSIDRTWMATIHRPSWSDPKPERTLRRLGENSLTHSPGEERARVTVVGSFLFGLWEGSIRQ